MVDLILFAFVCGVFAGGFWCGKRYGSFSAMVEALKQKWADLRK